MADEGELSRRHALAALGATSTAIAGCLDFLDGENGENGGDGGNGGNGDSNGGSPGDSGVSGPVEWPAIEDGEVLSDFEDLDVWREHEGQLQSAPDEARMGSQAAVLESDGDEAGISLAFPDGLDMEGWDVSMAVKTESVERIIVEYIAPANRTRLNSVRILPDGFDGWFRLDCGYEHKPHNEPDLSEVTQLNVVAIGPDDGPTRMVIDDLRRTPGVANGKAILVFYDGRRSHYDIGADLLEERGWPAAVPVDHERIGGQNWMTQEELETLQDRGWDVCSCPQSAGELGQYDEDQLRTYLERSQDVLANSYGFSGARHFFPPSWRQMTPTTLSVVRDLYDTGFVFGSCTTGVPPTGIHMIPMIWGPALHNGVRRHINLSDQYQQLTVIRVPPIVEGEASDSEISLDDFEHLIDHIEHRGLDVITPSDLVDGNLETVTPDSGSEGGGDEDAERPEGTILEAGQSYSFDGSGSGESDEFELSEGIVVGEFSHDGSSDFEVELTSADSRDRQLVTTSGSTSGESITTVDGGTYQAAVDADGSWSLTLDQPEINSSDLTDVPTEASGSGSAVVGPLWTESSLRLELTHDGSGTFIVDGCGADGSWEQIVNQTGEFDNSRSYDSNGVVWINIEATGNWTLEVTPQ